MFGVGEEVNLGYNLGIHWFPRANVCMKLGVSHPPIALGAKAVVVGDIVAKRFIWVWPVGAGAAVWVRACVHTLRPPLETMKSFLRKFMSFFR